MIKALSIPNFFAGQSSRFKFSPKVETKRQTVALKNTSTAAIMGTVLLSVNLLVLFSYVSGVNNRSQMGYEMKQLQQKIDSLNDENKKLNLKTAEATSILSLQNDLANSNFVAVGQPYFLQVSHVSLLTANQP